MLQLAQARGQFRILLLELGKLRFQLNLLSGRVDMAHIKTVAARSKAESPRVLSS